jgi:histone H3/H4
MKILDFLFRRNKDDDYDDIESLWRINALIAQNLTAQANAVSQLREDLKFLAEQTARVTVVQNDIVAHLTNENIEFNLGGGTKRTTSLH